MEPEPRKRNTTPPNDHNFSTVRIRSEEAKTFDRYLKSSPPTRGSIIQMTEVRKLILDPERKTATEKRKLAKGSENQQGKWDFENQIQLLEKKS